MYFNPLSLLFVLLLPSLAYSDLYSPTPIDFIELFNLSDVFSFTNENSNYIYSEGSTLFFVGSNYTSINLYAFSIDPQGQVGEVTIVPFADTSKQIMQVAVLSESLVAISTADSFEDVENTTLVIVNISPEIYQGPLVYEQVVPGSLYVGVVLYVHFPCLLFSCSPK